MSRNKKEKNSKSKKQENNTVEKQTEENCFEENHTEANLSEEKQAEEAGAEETHVEEHPAEESPFEEVDEKTTVRRVQMKKRMSTILVVLMFLAGLSLLLYPLVADTWNTYRQKRLISNYDSQISKMEEEGKIDYDQEWKKADDYNEALLPSILPDSFAIAEAAKEEDRPYLECLNLNGDGMMGYVEIPKINVKVPIFHTTETEVLERAAGHLEGSSLPVGGEDTHAVISAHRGLPSAKLFTDLDKMKKGDYFLIYVLDDVLCYEVDQIEVVEPKETDALRVEEGEDLVTLLTCTPYGVNSHRLLVRGHRVPYEQYEQSDAKDGASGVPSLRTNYLLWVIVGLVITLLFIVVLNRYDKKRRNQSSDQ